MNKEKAPDFVIGNRSDVGSVRSENQDYYGSYSGAFGQLVIVCDGMGAYEGGEIASRLAVEAISGHFARLGTAYEPRTEFETAFQLAQGSIREHGALHPETAGMGTTAVLLLIRDGKWWVANLGDSRLYLKREGKARQVTKDHSWVQGMVDSGIITAAQAADHPKRNIITKALGTEHFIPEVQGPYTLGRGDTFLLCSDGLYHYFSLSELEKHMESDPQTACQRLVDLANQRGGDDNITVQILKSNLGEKPRPAIYKKLPMLGVLLLCLVAIGMSAYWLVVYLRKPVQTEKAPVAQKEKPFQNGRPQTLVPEDKTEETKEPLSGSKPEDKARSTGDKKKSPPAPVKAPVQEQTKSPGTNSSATDSNQNPGSSAPVPSTGSPSTSGETSGP